MNRTIEIKRHGEKTSAHWLIVSPKLIFAAKADILHRSRPLLSFGQVSQLWRGVAKYGDSQSRNAAKYFGFGQAARSGLQRYATAKGPRQTNIELNDHLLRALISDPQPTLFRVTSWNGDN